MADELTFQAEVVEDLTTVPRDTWNALAGTDNPFVRYEFLAALERNDCVGDRYGWAPRHLILRLEGAIVGAMPMYLKGHSYGEFVFDWGWADAYEHIIMVAGVTPGVMKEELARASYLILRDVEGDVFGDGMAQLLIYH